MSREIKFKVWENDKKIFLSEHDVSFFSLDDMKYNDPHVFLQYTGLKDKNGKEVYEGDIIKWKETRFHNEQQKSKGVPMPKFYKSAVEWQYGEFIVSSDDNYDTPLCCFFGDSLGNKFDFKPEIIGNIYESPELLTKNLTVNDAEIIKN